MQPTNERLYNPRIDQLRSAAFLGVASLHFFTPTHTQLLEATPVVRWLAPFITNGYFGVSLFFLLSGHILTKLALEQGGGQISYGQFLLNRILRIYPLWVICLLLVMYTGKLSGQTMISALFLFVQDLPPTPWNVAWSVQQEFYLYLMFPILFANLTRVRHYVAVLGFCIAIRAGMSYNMAPQLLRDVSYSTIMGTVPLFVTGMILAHFPPILLSQRVRGFLLVAAVAAIWGVGALINYGGGFFFASQPRIFGLFWFFFPEVMTLVFALLLFAYDLCTKPGSVGFIGNLFATIGKISYSGYLLHVLMIDFVRHWLGQFGLGSINPFVQFVVYLAFLLPLAWLSFNVVEKPFLKFRRSYVGSAR